MCIYFVFPQPFLKTFSKILLELISVYDITAFDISIYAVSVYDISVYDISV